MSGTHPSAHSGIDSEGNKVFLPLENNPSILNPLAHALGLSSNYVFHDLYSFSDPDLLALIPCPALALLFVWPGTAKANAWQRAEVSAEELYEGTGDEPVLWFRQDVVNACGLMGLLHCTLNGHHALPSTATLTTNTATDSSTSTADASNNSNPLLGPSSPLSELRTAALPLPPPARAALIPASSAIERLHTQAALQGDTAPLALGEDPGHAFIAFVRGSDGILYEMNGCRKGPKALGRIPQGEDLLSEAALELTVRPFLEREEGENGTGMGMEFSCTVLAPVEW